MTISTIRTGFNPSLGFNIEEFISRSTDSTLTLIQIDELAPFLRKTKFSSCFTISNIDSLDARIQIFPNIRIFNTRVSSAFPKRGTKLKPTEDDVLRLELYTASKRYACLKYTLILDSQVKAELVKSESQQMLSMQNELEELRKKNELLISENTKAINARDNWYALTKSQKSKIEQLDAENQALFNLYCEAKTLTETSPASNREEWRSTYNMLKSEVKIMDDLYNV